MLIKETSLSWPGLPVALPSPASPSAVIVSPETLSRHSSSSPSRAHRPPQFALALPCSSQPISAVCYPAPTFLDVSEDRKWKKLGCDALASTFSALYGKLLVVMGIAFPMAEVISTYIPPSFYEGFYLYLYFGSMIFLVYMYATLLRDGKPKSKEKRKDVCDLDSSRSSSGAGGDSDAADTACPHVTTVRPAQHYGSFYLRMGAVAFGIGSMIYSGLEFGQYFELEQNTKCHNIMLALTPVLLGFGGGVLFCTMFLHLLPEVKEGLEHLTEKGKIPEFSFSLSEMLTCTGFFIMYLVEESIHSYLRKKKTHRKEFSKKDVSRSTNELVENGETLPNFISGHSHYNGHGHSHHLPVIIDEKHDFIISSLRGLLIILGLSVHELFEGLAIGLESSASYVWYMFAAVAAHKFVIAFCIGVELITYNTRRYLTIIYICTFAIVSPLGIAIGIFLVGGESAAASGILPVVLQGLASGTLLYVIFFEILQEHRNGFNQYLSILFGFILMFGLQLLKLSHRYLSQ